MSEPYYYADENSQPVGPLSLDEIRKIAEAGVVPPDVLICEADGENWRSLASLQESVAPASIAPPASQEKPTSASQLKVIYTTALVSALIAFVLDAFGTRAAVENSGVDPSGAREALSWVVLIGALAAQLVLLFHLVRAFPAQHRFTSPVKAAGFFVIPVFSLYWVFHLFHGLVSSTRKWGSETAPTLSAKITWLHPFAFVAAGLIALSEVVGYFDIFGAFEDSNVRAVRSNYLITYLVYAVGFAAFFHFTLSIVQILRGLLDPGEYEEESSREKERGFFSLGSFRWGPSYGYILFLIIAGAAWR